MPEKTKTFRRFLRLLTVTLLAVILALTAAGCGKKGPAASGQEENSAAELTLIEESIAEKEESAPAEDSADEGEGAEAKEEVSQTASDAPDPEKEETESPAEDAESSESLSEGAESAPEETDGNESADAENEPGGLLTAPMDPESPSDGLAFVEEDGEYTSKEQVAAYIHEFGHLPDNYITKKEAEELGWVSSKGNLWKVAPGKSIGGSRFGNYEGLLPDKKGRKYYECDIDFDGSFRGPERIIYSNDGLIFYTEDHYKTFEQLY
ncbi:MAG: ribonuclease [Lachnospiraceae bacterium]|nr:ribonuclease [Lachnospiraceae bacterium]